MRARRGKKKKEVGRRGGDVKSLGQILMGFDLEDAGGYISREFQDYGYRLAIDLGDEKHKALYIKMAKEIDRKILEDARSFVLDAEHARSKAKLFMWKVKQLKDK